MIINDCILVLCFGGSFLVQNGDGFVVETVDESCGVCFDGLVGVYRRATVQTGDGRAGMSLLGCCEFCEWTHNEEVPKSMRQQCYDRDHR